MLLQLLVQNQHQRRADAPEQIGQRALIKGAAALSIDAHTTVPSAGVDRLSLVVAALHHHPSAHCVQRVDQH